jgi:mono/diheme cytochrome c family protein
MGGMGGAGRSVDLAYRWGDVAESDDCAGGIRPLQCSLPLLAALALWLIACASSAGSGSEGVADAPADPLLAEMGVETFQRRCASCHGLSATGDGPAAGALRLPLPPADLTRIAERRGGAFPKAEVARFIDGRFFPTAHGSREMPIWGERFGAWIPESSLSEEITRGRIVTLVEYLKSIQRGD